MPKKNTSTLRGLQHALTTASALGKVHSGDDVPTGAQLFVSCECTGSKTTAIKAALKAAFDAARALPNA